MVGDLYEICAQANNHQQLFDYVYCLTQRQSVIPYNVDSCAQQVSLNATALKTCAYGSQGKQLLTASIAKTQQWQTRYSPTMYLQNEFYCVYGLPSECKAREYSDFVTSICNAYKGSSKPSACK